MFDAERYNSKGTSKRILLLQGPVGPFFRKVSKALRDQGHSSVQVCLTLPEYLLAGADDVVSFNSTRAEFTDFLKDIIISKRIDRILLMGCERFPHRVAIQLGVEMKIPVLCLEEGYVRPGLVTAEWMGNNRFSPLRSLSDDDLRAEPQTKHVERGSENRLVVLILVSIYHFIFRAIGSAYFGRHLYHRKRPLLFEVFYWFRNVFRKFVGRKHSEQTTRDLLQNFEDRFYILPLQVADDMQLVAAGRGWTNESFSEAAVRSFVDHAPKGTRLLIKTHPFDRGHPSNCKELLQLAKSLGAEDNVLVVDDGNLGNLTKKCCGMITINSTSGLLALHHGIPLGVAGEALYDRHSLSFSTETEVDLDKFWTKASPANTDLAKGFRRALFNRALLSGNFYSTQDSSCAAKAVTARLLNEVPAILTSQAVSKDKESPK